MNLEKNWRVKFCLIKCRVASNRQMTFDVWWFDQIIFDQIFKFWRFGQIFDQIMSNFHQIVKIHQKRKKIIWSKNEILMIWSKQFDEIWRNVIWSNVKFIWCNSNKVLFMTLIKWILSFVLFLEKNRIVKLNLFLENTHFCEFN